MTNDRDREDTVMSTASSTRPPMQQAGLPWHATSSVAMGLTGMLSRGFLYGLNRVEVTGLQRFLDILDTRKDPKLRMRGLITVSNHVSVLDDPLMWGILPLRYAFNPSNLRWGLGAHDICFKNKALSVFFGLGQVLPTHRHTYSSYGGPFQNTIPHAIRLLSEQPGNSSLPKSNSGLSTSEIHDNDNHDDMIISDPFTTGAGLTYTTTGHDSHRVPSVYAQNRLAWVHVFPEGCIHQHPALSMRYFKWGFSRLILETDPLPDVLPIFIDGTQNIMSESRTFPRFLPRIGHNFRVAFGELLDVEAKFGDLRKRWSDLVRREEEAALRLPQSEGKSTTLFSWITKSPHGEEKDSNLTQEDSSTQRRRWLSKRPVIGELTDELKYGREATQLRVEVARRMRDEIEKLRVQSGYPGEDPRLAIAESWARDPVTKA